MNKVIGWIIVLLLIVGGVWYFVSGSPKPATQQNQQTTEQTNIAVGEPNPNGGATTVTVTYDGTSFTPNLVNIHVGDTVTFVDNSANPMWVASGVHPSHTVYDETDRSTHCATGYTGPTPFDECKASTSSYSFTFTKAGTWPFHDHVHTSATGKVVVQ